MSRRLLIGGLLLALVGCGTFDPLPVVPPPAPVPVDPGPPAPTGHDIDAATFDAIALGSTEAEVTTKAGEPFRVVTAAGMRILEYPTTTGGIAWFVIDAGKVVRKARR